MGCVRNYVYMRTLMQARMRTYAYERVFVATVGLAESDMRV